MATQELADVLQYIRCLAGDRLGDETSDGQLLRRFVEQRDEGAFAAILLRHGPLVFGVCRQVLHEAHDAEDAFQATFLVLASKAASVRKHEALAAWLHRVALNIARTARVDSARRLAHERQALPMTQASPPEGEALRDWQPILHDEVDRLPAKYRVPVILCYFEEKTHDQAARELDWPVGTVKGHLARARDLLRARLARRGLAVSAGVSALLTESAVRAAIPAALAQSTLRAALQFAAGPAASALASDSTIRMALGAMKAPGSSRLVVALLIVAAAVGGGGFLALVSHARPVVESVPQAGPVLGAPQEAPAIRQRIVFLGESTTDGNKIGRAHV